MDKFNSLTYPNLLKTLQKIDLTDTIFSQIKTSKKYFIIDTKKTLPFNQPNHPDYDPTHPTFKYHITIFQDQWDDYQSPSGLTAKLFHITHGHYDQFRCSTYFILDKNLHIQEVPSADFSYNQPDFGPTKSRRSKCTNKSLEFIIRHFEELIGQIATYTRSHFARNRVI
jgi:hypothetical protein